jgi:hypothetical protein
MGGVGVQQFFILVFLFFAIEFHRLILKQIRQGVEGASTTLPLLYAIYGVLALITVHRSIPLQAQMLTIHKDKNHPPSLRIRAGIR